MFVASLLFSAALSPPVASRGSERLLVGISPAGGAAAVLLPLAPGGGERRIVRRPAAGDIVIDGTVAPTLLCATADDVATQCRPAGQSGSSRFDFTLDSGRTVTGVCFIGRDPAPGATVYVVPVHVESRRPLVIPLKVVKGKVVDSVTTGRDGSYTIDHLAPGDYAVEIHLAGGRIARSETVTILPKKKPSYGAVSLPAIRLRAGLALTVEVRGADGQPLEGAGVGIMQRTERAAPVFLEGRTAKSGTAIITGLEANATTTVTCTSSGYARTKTVFDALPRIATCVLDRLGRLHGLVVDEEQKPIANALITVGRLSTHSDPSGRFAASGLDPGAHHLVITAESRTVVSKDATITPNDDLDLGSIELAKGDRINGHVIDGESDLPLTGVAVALIEPPLGAPVLTGDDGSFQVDCDTTARPVLRISAAGYAMSRQMITGKEDLVIRLQRGGALEVTAWDEHAERPCGGCRIEAMGPADTGGVTDAAGMIRFEDLPAGRYAVSREIAQAGASMVSLSGGTDARIATVEPRKTAHLRLGEPSREVAISLDHLLPPPWRLAAVSSRGFEMAQDNGAGIFVVHVRTGEVYTLRINRNGASADAGLIPADYSADTFALQLGRGVVRLQISGRGQVVAIATVSGVTVATATPEADGMVELPFLHAGVYSILVGGKVVWSGVAVPDGVLDLGTITRDPQHP